LAGIEYRLGLRERTRTMKTLRAALVWLAVCILGGLLYALVWGEFGSVVAVLIGAILGASGALASCMVSVLQRYRLVRDRHVGAAVWVLAMSIFAVFEFIWRWTVEDVVFMTPIVAAIAVPLSYVVGRMYSVHAGSRRPT
jgi:hypothetical protein